MTGRIENAYGGATKLECKGDYQFDTLGKYIAEMITSIRSVNGFQLLDLRSPTEIRDDVNELETRFFRDNRSWQEVFRDQNMGVDIQRSKM